MRKIKIGVIREDKNPPDKRVALPPTICKKIKEKYSDFEIFIQPSEIRAFKNEEYAQLGFEIKEDLSDCDVLFGVKEVPKDKLIENKQYFFFSHTIKKQAYNKELLQTILAKNIQLTDYECLKYENGQRILGFGRYAGIVGAYNGLIGFGKKLNLFDLKAANLCFDKKEVEKELSKVKLLPNTKIVLTGGGRVASGILEILDFIGVEKISDRQDFIHNKFKKAVYFQAGVKDYVKHKSKSNWEDVEFYQSPENFESNFEDLIAVCDLLITGHYWDPNAPKLFELADIPKSNFNIKVIADITCDIDGSVPSTVKPSTIQNPFYDFDTEKNIATAPFAANKLTVMAVDNLPCELPRDASLDFGSAILEEVIPFLINDSDNRIMKASITKNANLTAPYLYLSDFVK
jgi:saccharopine dehydrogenase (NAD+, L-lysine forming)